MSSSQQESDACEIRGRLYRIVPLVLVALTLISYANSFSCPFMFDDGLIVRNAGLRHFSTFILYTRILTDMTFRINYKLSGYNVADYHATNLMIHIAAGLLLYGIIRRTLRLPRFSGITPPTASLLAGTCAAAWLIHPLQTESVTYICQRYESLMGMLCLASLYFFIRGIPSSSPRPWHCASLAACAAGMMAKEGMLIAPILAVLYDWFFLASSFRDVFKLRWRIHLALFLTIGILAPLSLGILEGQLFLGDVAPKAAPVSSWQYALTQLGVVPHYIRLAFFPHPLCMDYAWKVAGGFREVALPALFMTAVILCIILAVLRRQPLGYAGAWLLVTLAPSSSLIPIADMAVEHRMYLPLAGIVVIAVIAGWRICSRCSNLLPERLGAVPHLLAVTIMLASLGFLTFERNRTYASGEEMAADVVNQAPDNFRARLALCSGLFARGDLADAERMTRESIASLQSKSAAERLKLANLSSSNVEFYMPHAHNLLGRILMSAGHLTEAEIEFREALRSLPDSAVFLNNLSAVYYLRGDIENAVILARASIASNPRYTKPHALMGDIMTRQKRFADAVAHYRTVMRFDDLDWEVACQLAWILSTVPDESLRNGREALTFALRACTATDHASLKALLVLAAASAEIGDLATAVSAADKADNLQSGISATSSGNRTVDLGGEKISTDDLLSVLRSGKPYRMQPPRKEQQ